jgi:hypothetical protein
MWSKLSATLLTSSLVTAVLLLQAVPAAAEIRPSSDVLVPYFEVVLDEECRTTLFAVANAGDDPVEVVAAVHTNWGIPVLAVSKTIGGDEVWTVNLKDWILLGNLPDGTLTQPELDHIQAALAGRPSPKDDLYYGGDKSPDRDVAVGYVTIRVQGSRRPDVLWGDYFIVCPEEKFTQGETLVNIDRTNECERPCSTHAIRFLNEGAFAGGTELMIWTPRRLPPSPNPVPSPVALGKTEIDCYDEAGRLIEHESLRLIPSEILDVRDMQLPEAFGWVEITTDTEAFITGHFSAQGELSSALHAWCLPEPRGGGVVPRPGIAIEKKVNGVAAGSPPGPTIRVGGAITWQYLVTNTGDLPLSGIVVEDGELAVTCPRTELDPGESMTCTASGTAEACQQTNTAWAHAFGPEGEEVSDRDIAFYQGEEHGAVDVEKLVNGEDADTAPGLLVSFGAALTFQYVVTNTGEVPLIDLVVTDSDGLAVSCPKDRLEPGESMTCTAGATAQAGPHVNLGIVLGRPKCGPDVRDQDPAHYQAYEEAAIGIQKLTNGEDADLPPGPYVNVGAPVSWTYIVTNPGPSTLTNVTVTDDRGVAVACPKAMLLSGESMTCTAGGTAVAGQYANVGTARGTPPLGPGVAASDPSHYFGQWPQIRLEKLTNGEDADAPTGPVVLVGGPVLWTFVVTNTGDVPLFDVTVIDRWGDEDGSNAAVPCPKNQLAPGESMTCSRTGTAASGQYANLGTVTARPENGEPVSAADPSHYLGEWPPAGIAIEKLIDGEDADLPPGVSVLAGQAILWTYVVTNTGQVALNPVTVTDDQGVTVTCPKAALEPGESMTCTSQGFAVAGPYANIGTAAGQPPAGDPVTASDPCHYYGYQPAIDLEKWTNGQDADDPPGPEVLVGSTVQWLYLVTNRGDVSLADVTVTDDTLGPVTCPKSVLTLGEVMTCSASGTAALGQHANLGTASGTALGATVTDTDPSHYVGVEPGDQGCTPGYWKNHTDSWPPTGYSPSQKVKTVFASATAYAPLGNSTLLQALSFDGGSGVEGAAEILLRAAVAALMNASHPDVSYPRTAIDVIVSTNAALDAHDRDTMLVLAAALDADNNLGCPLH